MATIIAAVQYISRTHHPRKAEENKTSFIDTQVFTGHSSPGQFCSAPVKWPLFHRVKLHRFIIRLMSGQFRRARCVVFLSSYLYAIIWRNGPHTLHVWYSDYFQFAETEHIPCVLCWASKQTCPVFKGILAYIKMDKALGHKVAERIYIATVMVT